MAKPKGIDFGITRKLQRAYEQGIKTITSHILVPKPPGMSFEDWLAGMYAKAQSQYIGAAANELAKRMVISVNIKNAKTWREAASRSFQAQKLYKLLQHEMSGPVGARVQQLIRENAALIKSVPLESAQRLTDEVRKAQQMGARAGTIDKMMRTRFPKLVRSRTRLIARTETAKASTALTQARCEHVGADWYIWESSQDGDRVRPSHRLMQGVVVPWSQPPAPELLNGEKSTLGHYHVGECPNCRCTAIVVLTVDDITFPARVYWQGSIKQMNKQQFKQIAVGLESRGE